jgi:hypothetical protein
LPSTIIQKDLNKLASHFEQKIKSSIDSITMCETYLVNKTFLKNFNTKMTTQMETKSDDDLKKPNYVLAFRTQHAIVANLGIYFVLYLL